LKDFKKIFSKLQNVDPAIPFFCAAGNHDVGNTPTQETIATYRATFGDDYYSYWYGGVKFIVPNAQYLQDPSQVSQNYQMVSVVSQ
jgi:hypothetical protein